MFERYFQTEKMVSVTNLKFETCAGHIFDTIYSILLNYRCSLQTSHKINAKESFYFGGRKENFLGRDTQHVQLKGRMQPPKRNPPIDDTICAQLTKQNHNIA